MSDIETNLPPDIKRRFGALVRLYGSSGAALIRSSHVVIVGLGGVGSWAAEAAARSGVARLTLIDMDHLSESNINRQVHALTSTLGQAKVLAMRNRIALINPDCVVDCLDEFAGANNWPSLLANLPDFSFVNSPLAVLDACDNVPAKTAMTAWSLKNPLVKFVTVGAAGGKRLAHLMCMDDLAAATHDPLLSRLRTNLRKFHAAPRSGKPMGIKCVFSKESVLHPPLASMSEDSHDKQSDHSLNCHGYGSTVCVTAAFGFAAMGWLINELTLPGKIQKLTL